MCDFMQALTRPVPGSIRAHRFVTSVLHTFPLTATVSTRSSQVGERSVNGHELSGSKGERARTWRCLYCDKIDPLTSPEMERWIKGPLKPPKGE
jgi:hypothetical protein